MTPTRPRVLVALLVGVAALSWGALRVAESRGAMLPVLGWTTPAGIVLLAVAVAVAALALRGRLRGGRPPHPLGVARMAVLGKASAHVGPLVGGLYLGYLVLLVSRLDVGDARVRALVCAVALLGSAGVTVAGLLMERLCRVPPADTDDEVPTANA